MLKKLKGQGAIEYLLILGAVLVIAAIVTMLVLNFSTKGPEQMQKECFQAKKQAAALLSSYGIKGKTTDAVEAVKSICSPCYKLDKYYIDSGKKQGCSNVPSLDEIIQTPLTYSGGTISGTTPGGGTTVKITQSDYSYYYKCLTVSPATL